VQIDGPSVLLEPNAALEQRRGHAPYRPSDRELGLLDVLARQAADILERRQAEQTQRLLVNELNHRVKNTLASVQAIAQHTLRRTRDPAEFVTSFAGRIQSLSRVHSILSNTTWQGADLRELIRDQLLLGSVDEARLTSWGPAAPSTNRDVGPDYSITSSAPRGHLGDLCVEDSEPIFVTCC
jgi:signal transduction histidine kinase